ncbi:MAG: hypothetical protein WBQ89_28770 [Candidatus Acidiferrum sp.]
MDATAYFAVLTSYRIRTTAILALLQGGRQGASGTTNGVVWVVENTCPAVLHLHAYDVTNLANELHNSNQAPNGKDNFSNNKFITPMVANGKVYVGTSTGVAVLAFTDFSLPAWTQITPASLSILWLTPD